MMSKAKRRIALVVLAAAGLAALAPSAQGGRAVGPIAVAACAQNVQGPCSESGNIGLPPNSYGSQSTDTVPTHAKDASAILNPLSAKDLSAFDSTWVDVVAQYPNFAKVRSTFVKRVITCSILAAGVASVIEPAGSTIVDRQQLYADNYAAALAICLQAALAQPAPARAATAASTACHTEVSVPIEVARVGGRYRVLVIGKTFRPSRRPALAVSCRRTGHGLHVTLRPRAHGVKLRQLVGPKFSIGYVNPTSHSEGIHTTFTFK